MDRQGEIIDAICAEAGIEERRVPNAGVIYKKEALQILNYIKTLKALLNRRNGDERT